MLRNVMKIYFAGVPGGDQEVRERDEEFMCFKKTHFFLL